MVRPRRRGILSLLIGFHGRSEGEKIDEVMHLFLIKLIVTSSVLAATNAPQERSTRTDGQGQGQGVLNHSSISHRSNGVLKLGYLTGSLRDESNLYAKYAKPGQLISGAITMAVTEINETPEILPNHRLEFIVAETYGRESDSIRQTVELLRQNVSAYIGPQETCVHEARIAASFNIPMISYFCTARELSDKRIFPTFARTKPHDSQISKAVVSLLLKYNWTRIVLVYHNKEPLLSLASTLRSAFKNYSIDVTSSSPFDGFLYYDFGDTSPFSRIIDETFQTTRVYVMLADTYEYQNLLFALKRKGLVDTGEYVVIGIDPSKMYNPSDPQIYVKGMAIDLDPDLPDLDTASRNFLVVAPAAPDTKLFANFSTIVNHYLEAPPFNYRNSFKNHNILKRVRPEAAYLYDAVWIYARAAHEVLEAGLDLSNGTLVMNFITNKKYRSALGYMIRMDDNGDPDGNFTLLARRLGGSDETDYGMYPVGSFMLNEVDTSLPELRLLDRNAGIIPWIGGRPPLAEPLCGFRGEKCIPTADNTAKIASISTCGVSSILVIIAILIYRNWKYEQELASLLWKIDLKDVTMIKVASISYTGGSSYFSKVPTSIEASNVSLSSQNEFDLRQVFTQVGSYRGTIVAVKRIKRKSVDLTRSIRMEFKLIREIRHDNLNTIIGASIDPGSVCILTEYCSRGSLLDILANESLKLDSMFIASLILDMLRGMIYLHDSSIHSHGRLKSSNCVVDYRWVLKITDYGLAEFKDVGLNSLVTAKNDDDQSYFHGLLWTAPELLRCLALSRSGTQKGDVYSFAIILYEIHIRQEPFAHLDLSPRDIIDRVRHSPATSDGPPFRPRLSLLADVPKFVTDCIKECWNEDPSQRPEFKVIRRMLKPMQRGIKSNIFDNMIAKLEKYSKNLEEIVDERTDQLREEKRKTEELLHQMLPPSVANQLKRGKMVEAELFDLVTIYFSDICGFTEISSESTPMQVVALLNDLYTVFDSIIENYDVYKVETIGDAYMVASGLPLADDGIQHVGQIASMSLHLLEEIQRFRIRHRPNDTLKLRIGMHSGPCVAGVVGHKMPRYCLFGDTVNTASRMESTGEALKIHCSENSKLLLDRVGGYRLEERGLTSVKGKGEMRTYWLTGEDRSRRRCYAATHIDQIVSTTALPGTSGCRVATSCCSCSSNSNNISNCCHPTGGIVAPIKANERRKLYVLPSISSMPAIRQTASGKIDPFSIKTGEGVQLLKPLSHRLTDSDYCSEASTLPRPRDRESPPTSGMNWSGFADVTIHTNSPECDRTERRHLWSAADHQILKTSVSGSVRRQQMAASGRSTSVVVASLAMATPLESCGFRRFRSASACVSSSTKSSGGGVRSMDDDNENIEDRSTVAVDAGCGPTVAGSAVTTVTASRQLSNQSAGNETIV